MKKIKFIIATLFVVAVGAGVFWACQKEETAENSSITTTSNKIQKENLPPGITYTADFYREINGKCYHVTGTYFEWTDINNIRHGMSDGLIYTEVDCNSYLVQEVSTVEFSYNPIWDCDFSTVAQYTNPANYTFTVTVGEMLSPELLYLFKQDALICMYDLMF